ncbi:MAG TPA: ABC transporter permease subunit [Edaphobacter sp.]|nr:ABC transporter permease subunit [Edaphobacter sp.]
MLWYKSLREIRNVTLVGMAGMAAACVLIVWNEKAMRWNADPQLSYVAYIWKSVYNSIGRDLFALLAIILGSGGLLQEKAQGTSGFTLSLPASRRTIVLTRAVIGYLGVLAIAAVPVLVVPLVSQYFGEIYPVEQSAGFFFLWAGCGAVFYGLTFLLAHRIESEYVSVLIAIPSLMLYGATLNLPWLARLQMFDLFSLMNGEDMPFFNEGSHLLVGPLPWVALCTMLAMSAAFAIAAARRMQPLDF